MNSNLFSVLFDAWKDDSSRPCIRLPDGESLSFQQVYRRSGKFANCLKSHGVVSGDRVAAKVDKSPDALILYLSCLRVGAVFLPLNTGYTDNEVKYFVGDAKPRLLVCPDAQKENLEKAAAVHSETRVATFDRDGRGSFLAMAEECAEETEVVSRFEDDLAAILYTSGTTGRPKGAMLTHGNLASNSQALKETWRYDETDILIHALPIFHTHGLFVACNLTFLSGASMIFMEKFDTRQIIKNIPSATVLMGVPTFYVRLLEEADFTKDLVSNMRLFISGSAPMTVEVHNEFIERTGQTILERYGMTEANMITSNPYSGGRFPGTVGFPLPKVTVRIADPDTGTPLPQGSIGMVEIKGPNLFKGYWELPEKTKEEFRDDGFFITGDLGTINDKGYISIVGRSKDLVISGGYNIYPKEIEQEIDALDGVAESAVIGVPHKDLGEGVVGVVVAEKNQDLDGENVRLALRQNLAAYKVPKAVFLVTELPRNAMGKVQKNLLRERYQNSLV